MIAELPLGVAGAISAAATAKTTTPAQSRRRLNIAANPEEAAVHG